MRPDALILTARQRRMVEQHTAALPMQLGDHYLRSVAANLRGAPTDGAVVQAINNALDRALAFSNGT